jgi:hypothetical protein
VEARRLGYIALFVPFAGFGIIGLVVPMPGAVPPMLFFMFWSPELFMAICTAFIAPPRSWLASACSAR